MNTYILPSEVTLNDLMSLLEIPYSVFLDTSMVAHHDSQYSYIGFSPYSVLCVTESGLTQTFRDNSEIKHSENPHLFFQSLMKSWQGFESQESRFSGGLMGYIAYEALHQFPDFLHLNRLEKQIFPDMIWGIYDRVICWDHHTSQAELIVQEWLSGVPFSLSGLMTLIQQKSATRQFAVKGSVSGKSYDDYQFHLDQILDWIAKGHTYQVNYSQRFNVPYQGDVLSLYKALRCSMAAPYSAYLNYPDFQICSMSPELFVSKQGTSVVTSPIKGTIERGKTQAVDEANKKLLLNSEKDRAELTMIVDLERNDLKKICQTGTVDVRGIHQLLSFSHVHHLVSNITGELMPEVTSWDILLALFPGGSITGAPKIRSVEIINELESAPRFIYTGCIGYIGINGSMKLNIAIRTLYAHNKNIYFHSGSGIVSDSIPINEWNELASKIQGIYETLR